MLKIKILLSSVAALFYSFGALAQGQGNSPYSVYGFGELAEQSSASQDMMGGVGASFSNAFYINRINPAMLVKNRMAAGLKYVAFDVGFRGYSRSILTTDKALNDFGLNLNLLSFTSAITKDWAMAVSLSPYSTVDYNGKQQKSIVGSVNETVVSSSSNSGGVARISFINSFRLFNKVYVGVDANYNYGTIKRGSGNYLSGHLTNQLQTNYRYVLKGLGLKLGAGYQYPINEKWKANIGAAYELSSQLKTNELRTFGTYASDGDGSFLISRLDTLGIRNFHSKTPDQLRVGLSVESSFHWVFAADYHRVVWANSNPIDAVSKKVLHNAEGYHFGAEYLPNSSSTKYLNQVFYRIGFTHNKTPYYLRNTRIKDNSISLGVSLPMGFRNPSYVNLGLALGRRGVTTNNLVQENYLKFSLSTSLLSPWYIKPKID